MFSTQLDNCISFVHIFDIIAVFPAEFNRFPNNPWFLGLWWNRLLKTLWEEEKMPVTGIFSISHNVFSPSQNKYQFFGYIYFVVCKCFEFEQVQNFTIWERVKKA